MRRAVIFAITLIFLCGSVLAVSSDFKESYNPKETAVGKISGINSPISEGQIKLKRNNVDIAFEYGVQDLNGNYYVWFVAPTNPANYTLLIEDLISNSGGGMQMQDYMKNFSVGGEVSGYTVKPGAIFSSQDFEITVVLNKDESETVSVSFPEVHNVELNSGNNKIKFFVKDFESSFFGIVSVGNYEIPAFVFGTKKINQSENDTISEGNGSLNETNSSSTNLNQSVNFKLGSNVIVFSKPKNFNSGYVDFQITNLADVPLRDLQFWYNREKLRINSENDLEIAPGEEKDFRVDFLETSNLSREVVIAYSGNYSQYFLIVFNESMQNDNSSTQYLEDEQGNSYFYCSELSGKICTTGEVCSGNEVNSLDGVCCLSECSVQKSSGSSWIGYLLGGILILVIAYIFIKYRKAGGNKEGAIRNKINFAGSRS